MTLLKRIGVEHEERSLFGWAGLCLLLVGAGSAALQNAAETLFLKRVGVEMLPLVFLVSSVILAAATTLVGRALGSADRPRWLPRVLFALALTLIPVWVLVFLQVAGVLPSLLVLVKLLDGIALLAFWIALGDLITGRQAKRLFAPLAAGITIGRLLGSFGTEPASKIAGIEGLVLFAGGLYALAAVAALFLRRSQKTAARSGTDVRAGAREQVAAPHSARTHGPSLRRIWRESRLFRFLVLWSFCAGALGPMLYFQFSYAVDLSTKGVDGEQQMLALYAQFRGWLNFAILVMQLAVSGKLYRRFGLPMSSCAWPMTYLAGFLWMGIALNLPVAMAAIAAVRLEGDAVAKPALKILHNLLPERFRSRATGVTEGPVKGLGGAFGNAIVIGAIALGGPAIVSLPALPLAFIWLLAALGLWRHYPRLLLQASSEHSLPSGEDDLKRLLDPATVRALAASLSDPDPDVCRAAADLIREAEPSTAARPLATAIESAPSQTRSALIEALSIVLESSPPGAIRDARASEAIARVLEDRDALAPDERADLVQIYARLAASRPEGEIDAVLDAALGDPEAAVRLAATAELSRRGVPPPGVRDLDSALSGVLQSGDVLLRRTARKEIRANLLASEPNPVWERRLDLLASGLIQRVDREETVRCLADIAHRHPSATGRVRDPLLRLLSDTDPHVRAAVIAFIGKAGIIDRVGDLLEGLASRNDVVVRAAQNALIALGAAAIDELAAGFRSDDVSCRDLVVQILSSLGAESTVFTQIYDVELQRTRTRAVLRAALMCESKISNHLLLRYLDERIEEGLNACLCLTGAATGSDRIADLETKLRSSRDSHQRAILIEAMESLLSAEKRAELVQLYEIEDALERGKVAARWLKIALPAREQAWSDLASDSDELVVRLQAELPPPWLVAEDPITDTRGVSMQTMQITAHLQRAPAFNRLAMRELVRVAEAVDEIQLDSDKILFEAGEDRASLYLLISGEISLSLRDTEIASVGPGSLIGELASIDGGLSMERARAVSPAVALRLRREPLMALMADAPAFAIALSQILAARVRSLQSELGERPGTQHQQHGDD
ncbi:MAG: HEAT repeat domain-containing protein [Deltaproteobacteria bacterium]|nr:HEAT repeat domain-containing protein [Deltaproteobacteria bacterium]